MRERQTLDDGIGAVRRLEQALADNIELIEMGEAEGDAAIVAEAEASIKAMAGEVLAGLRTMLLPDTMAAELMPAIIAPGKFQGGMMTPTPSGMYLSSVSSSW